MQVPEQKERTLPILQGARMNRADHLCGGTTEETIGRDSFLVFEEKKSQDRHILCSELATKHVLKPARIKDLNW